MPVVIVLLSMILIGCQSSTNSFKSDSSPSKQEKSASAEPLSKMMQQFEHCRQSDDMQPCSDAIDVAEIYLENHTSNIGLAYAVLGSSYAFSARNFPLPYLWYVVPGPGFYRLYQVNRAVTYLDKAYALDAENLHVKRIYASTMTGLPEVFMQREKGMKVMRELERQE